MNSIRHFRSWLTFTLSLLFIITSCKPIRSITTRPAPWSDNQLPVVNTPLPDPQKKNVLIVADPKLTEIFDMLAPFYLFNATGEANVFIIAKDRTPILIKKDLFICPQLTFYEADSLKLQADVIVIPALSARDENQDSSVVSWIKAHVATHTKLLTICDGASTGASTGLYDGKQITCHASDIDAIKKHFPKPIWVQHTSVAREGNLFSTAGVSNAVEGSLTVMEEIFGSETARKVAASINYPHEKIRLTHQSVALSTANKMTVLKKIFFRKNRNIGVLLENGINEFAMASLIDTYGRTFPATFQTFIMNDSTIRTMHGLTVIHKGKNNLRKLHELHVPMPETFSTAAGSYFGKIRIIRYENSSRDYLFDVYLNRIAKLYGSKYSNFVKISLDYN